MLSFEQAPPADVPYRFFLTAPLFLLLAAALLLWRGEAVLLSRWTPEALAFTHLLTTGFMLQVMLGALWQFIPVATGSNLWRPRLLAGLVHPLLTLAAPCLAWGLLRGEQDCLRAAALLFSLAGLILLPATAAALVRRLPPSPTLSALRLALAGLTLTLLLGLLLLSLRLGGAVWPAGSALTALTDIHLGWGLGVWGLGLLAGVAYLVVPMFQLTPPYPSLLTRTLLPLLVLAACLRSLPLLAWWLPDDLPADAAALHLLRLTGDALFALAGAALAGVTLWLQGRRRRRIADPGLSLFRSGMLALLAAIPAGLAGLPVLMACCLLTLFVTVMVAMLYRIVPFLNCLHLQGRSSTPVTVGRMLAEAPQRQSARLLYLAAMALGAAALWPSLARLAGGCWLLAAGMLWRNLGMAIGRYFRWPGRRHGASEHSPAQASGIN